VAEWLLENGLDVLIAQHDQTGKGPAFVQGDSGAEIVLTEATDVDKALASIRTEVGETRP
jgi:hypothetical protein